MLSVRIRQTSGNTDIHQTHFRDDIVSQALLRGNRSFSTLISACIVFVARRSGCNTNLPLCRMREAIARLRRAAFNSKTRVVCIGNTFHSLRRPIKHLVRSVGYASPGGVLGPLLTGRMHCLGRARKKESRVYETFRRITQRSTESTRCRGTMQATGGVLTLKRLGLRAVTRYARLSLSRMGTLTSGGPT